MLSQKELNKLEKGLYFNKKYLIGSGLGGYVYKINDKYVVKKLFSKWKYLKNEFETTILLSIYGISPKVIYHSNKNDKYKYYVMEKLDYTVYNMIKNKQFTEYHLGKLNNIFIKLSKTKYKHTDLHLGNIMWSNFHNDFRIIDWELYYITNNNNNKLYKNLIKRIRYLMNNEYTVYKILGYKIFKIKCLN